VLSNVRPGWAYWCGFAAGTVMTLVVALYESPPGWVEQWQVGAWGEE
jgi:hypothetical protein